MHRLLLPLLAASVVLAAVLGVRLSTTTSLAEDVPVFQLPWPVGESWRLTNYPHPSYGWNSPPDGAIDFQPPGYIGCDPFVAQDRFVRPVSAGTVAYVGDFIIEVAHIGGYTSFYYHVANSRVAPGDAVSVDTDLGNPSCYDRPGASVATTGAHVHFAMKRDGEFISLVGLTLAGWEVTATGLLKDGLLLTEAGIPLVSNELQPGLVSPTPVPSETPAPGADPWAPLEPGWSYRKLPSLEGSAWADQIPCVEGIYQWEDGGWLRGLPGRSFASQLEATRVGPYYWVLADGACSVGGTASEGGPAKSEQPLDAHDERADGPPEGP